MPVGFWAHGRYYGGWRPRKYLFPIDEEEANRLDLFNQFFLVARKQAIATRRLSFDRPLRVLDLGTGTGIWAITVCDSVGPEGVIPEVMAVDLNRIQPNFIPRGFVPMQFDIEDPCWDPLLMDCDLVHLRMLYGSIQTDLWPETYHKIFQRLTPGTGTLEHVEIDWVPRWEGSGDTPPNSALLDWANQFLAALDLFSRSARVVPQAVRTMIERAGFVDFKEQTIRCYVNPWMADKDDQLTARWFNLSLKHSMESMSLMPMVEKLGMTVEEVKHLCEQAKDECTRLRYHGYCTMYIWTARKPADGPSTRRSEMGHSLQARQMYERTNAGSEGLKDYWHSESDQQHRLKPNCLS
ncbi:hypothetical protein RJ55_07183 [Drechmeria coniospora]|nr:hypothetical protein RJ55_07183 [Drechmeria coniospora]